MIDKKIQAIISKNYIPYKPTRQFSLFFL